MDNATIIMRESFRLMEAGLLSGSGRFATIDGPDGPETIELPEAIHTFAAWKARGYIVRKGEHAVAAFPVWKYRERRRQADDVDGETDGEQETGGRCYMCKAFFFRASQVEKITP